MAPTLAESHEDLFLEVIPKEDLLEKMSAQKVAQKFIGQVWGNSGQILRNPKICLLLHLCAALHHPPRLLRLTVTRN